MSFKASTQVTKCQYHSKSQAIRNMSLYKEVSPTTGLHYTKLSCQENQKSQTSTLLVATVHKYPPHSDSPHILLLSCQFFPEPFSLVFSFIICHDKTPLASNSLEIPPSPPKKKSIPLPFFSPFPPHVLSFNAVNRFTD